MDRWHTHQPDPRWYVVDPRILKNQLLAMAGIDDLEPIKERLSKIREELTTLKEQGISLLTVAAGTVRDGYVDRKLQEVNGIVIAAPEQIAPDLARDGPDWSRDS